MFLPCLLITRPEDRVKRLARCAMQLGWETIACETLHIESVVDDADLIARIQPVIESSTIIFVSQHAVKYFFRYASTYPREAVTLAIGPTTERALAEQGINTSASSVPPYTSEALLSLPVLQKVHGQQITIIAGEGGRDTLENTLKERGAHVRRLAVYRRVCPKKDLTGVLTEWKACVRLVVGTSRASLSNLVALMKTDKAWLCALPLIVVSGRLADIARDSLGFQNNKIIVAPDPSEEGLAQSVASYILQRSLDHKDVV